MDTCFKKNIYVCMYIISSATQRIYTTSQEVKKFDDLFIFIANFYFPIIRNIMDLIKKSRRSITIKK